MTQQRGMNHFTESEIANALAGKFYRVPNSDRAAGERPRAWGAGDSARLAALYRDGKTHDEISRIMDRGRTMIVDRVRELVEEGVVAGRHRGRKKTRNGGLT